MISRCRMVPYVRSCGGVKDSNESTRRSSAVLEQAEETASISSRESQAEASE